MAQLTTDDVIRIAQLARLHLTTDEVQNATDDLGKILSNFAAIQAIDTSKATTSDAVSDRQNVTRADEPVSGYLCDPAELLVRAPGLHGSQFKVPAVFS